MNVSSVTIGSWVAVSDRTPIRTTIDVMTAPRSLKAPPHSPTSDELTGRRLSVPIGSFHVMQLAERVRSWLPPSRSQAQPEDAFRSLWGKIARADATRHLFHREVLINLDRLIAEATATAPDTLVEVIGIPSRWDDMPQRYSHMFRRLTPVWMGDFVIAEVARGRSVADSTDYLTSPARDLRVEPLRSDGPSLRLPHRHHGRAGSTICGCRVSASRRVYATAFMPLTSAWAPRREVSGHIVRRRSLEGAVGRRGW